MELELSDAAVKYSNFLKIGEDGIPELYCDNHILSHFRKCQGYFEEAFINNVHTQGRSWSFEFGQYLHKCMEYFYQAQRTNWEVPFSIEHEVLNLGIQTFEYEPNIKGFLELCDYFWDVYKLEDHKDSKRYKTFGGRDGATLLFSQYFSIHFRQERLRFVGWELSFGKNKEVPIIDENTRIRSGLKFRAYYCGRIDLAVDDGSVIGPLDHKTTAYFNGTESSNFKPHDGMQGYTFSLQSMLGEKLRSEGRICNSIIINHISLQQTKTARERFKRSYKSYSPGEMIEWRERQISTFKQIWNFMFEGDVATWNTEQCSRWYYGSDCPYKKLHEVAPVSRKYVIKTDYLLKEGWDYATVK